MKMKRRSISAVLFCAVVLLTPGVLVAAPQTKQPAGITVAPFLQSVSVASFETSKQITVTVANHTTSKRLLKVSVADFGSLNETGGVAFVGESSKTALKHGLKNWLTLDRTQLTLAPGQQIKVNGTVNTDKGFEPGGHYGAILFNQVDSFSQPASTVAASPTVSALVFVDKLGGETHDLHLADVSFSRSWWQLPSVATLRFQDPANTEVVPRGTITITRGKQVVKRGIINEDSAIILPGTFRQLPVNLFAVSGSWLPGSYQVDVSYRYEGVAQTMHHRQKLLVIPLPFMILIVVMFAFVAAGWHWRRKLPKIAVFHR